MFDWCIGRAGGPAVAAHGGCALPVNMQMCCRSIMEAAGRGATRLPARAAAKARCAAASGGIGEQRLWKESVPGRRAGLRPQGVGGECGGGARGSQLARRPRGRRRLGGASRGLRPSGSASSLRRRRRRRRLLLLPAAAAGGGLRRRGARGNTRGLGFKGREFSLKRSKKRV